MLEAFSAVVPVFLIILLGMGLRAGDVLPGHTGDAMGLYVLRAALPALLLHLLAGARPEDWLHPALWLGTLGAQIVTCLVAGLGDRLLFRRGTGPALVSAMGASSCNAAFVGLPIILNVFPGSAEAMLVAGLVIMTPNVITVLVQIRFDLLAGAAPKREETAGERACRLLRTVILGNPVLMAIVAGFLLSVSGLGLWTPLDRAANLVGLTAAPCMLLALGFDLQRKMAAIGGRRSVLIWQGCVVGLKLIACPLVAWAVMEALVLPPTWIVTATLICATGTALVTSVLATVYAAIPGEAAFTVLLSNGLSMLTLTAFIRVFRALGYC